MSIKGRVNYCLYKFLPTDEYLKIAYKRYHKRKLNTKSPETFTEKLFLMKAYNESTYGEDIRKYYDKFRVREYVKKTIGEKYLTEIYGVWNSADEISFDDLPEECILKITQSSGFNKICLKGYKKEQEKIKSQLQDWLEFTNNKKNAEKLYKIEKYYFDGKAQILAEELLKTGDNAIPEDVRIYCFNGKAEFFTIDYDSVSQEGIKLHEYCRNVYDIDGNFLPYTFGRENDERYKEHNITNLPEMIKVAEKLSKPFIFVRVDLYNIKGRIVFGELTWIPMGGAGRVLPYEFDRELGEKLPVIKK